MSIFGSLAATALGSLLDSGGNETQQQTQQTWANPFQANSGMFNTGWDGDNLNMGIEDPELQSILQQVMGGSQGMFDQSLNSPTADLARQSGFDFLSQAGETDPYQIAQSQFDKMNPMLQKGFDQDRLDMEGRQFAQGRLGSTGGAQDMEALFNSQNDARTKLMFDSLGQGMQTQQHMYGMGSNFANLDPALRGQYQNLGSGFLNIPLQFQQAMLNQAQVGGGVAGANTVGSLTDNSLDPMNTIGAGLMNSGAQGISNTIGEWFNPGSVSSPSNYKSSPVQNY